MDIDLSMFGLSGHESAVYASLVTEGPAVLATLAKRINRHRPTVSIAVKALVKRGIIKTQKRGQRQLFVALSPMALRQDFAQRSSDATEALESLDRAYMKQSEAMTVREIEGKTALRQLFLDMVERLPKEGVFYRYIAGSDRQDIEPYVHPGYRETRDKKNIQQLAITSVAMKGKPFKKGMGCLWKVIPQQEDQFEYGIAQLIFGNTVAFIDYVTETAVIIEGARFAKYQAAIHRSLYTRLSDRVV
jgi:predicted transcriptional regulator